MESTQLPTIAGKTNLKPWAKPGSATALPPPQLKEIKKLEKENALLKKLLAEKQLEGHLKDEVIKKNHAWARKNK